MPKIPIPDIQRLPQHQDNATHFNSAPGLDWNVDHSDPGKAWKDLGNNVLRAGLSIGNDLMNIAERKQAAEDSDNLRELELLELRAENDLIAYMRENPDAWNDYARMNSNWREERLQKQQELLDKMSPQTKKGAEHFIKKNYIRQDAMVENFSFQAFAASKMTNLDNQTAELAKMGGQKELAFRFIDDAVLDGVLTQEMADARKEHFMEQDDFFRVRELIEADDPDIIDKLKKKTDGAFTEYTHLTRDQREQLIRAAKTQQTQRETEEEYRIRAEFVLGNIPTEETLKTDLRTGKITNKQFVQQMGLLTQYKENKAAEEKRIKTEAKQAATAAEQSLKEAFEASHHLGQPMYSTQAELNTALQKGEISPALYNDFSEYLKKVENARKTAETEARQAATRKTEALRDSYKLDIIQMDFPNNPNEAYDLFKDTWDELKAHVKDNKALIDLYSTLKAQLDKGLKVEQDEFKTPEGKIVKDFIEKTYRKGTNFQGLYYDPNGLFNKTDDQTFMQARYYEIFEIARKRLNAGKTASEVTKEIQEQVNQLNDGKIKNILGDMYSAPKQPVEEPITRASAPLMPH